MIIDGFVTRIADGTFRDTQALDAINSNTSGIKRYIEHRALKTYEVLRRNLPLDKMFGALVLPGGSTVDATKTPVGLPHDQDKKPYPVATAQ